jgi:hypothetical protein
MFCELGFGDWFKSFLALPAYAGDECTAVHGTGAHTFSPATGSPGELGLLKMCCALIHPVRNRKAADCRCP